jgi:hypothetical protein
LGDRTGGIRRREGGALYGTLEKRQAQKEEEIKEYVYEKSIVFGMKV